ncbi:MAG: oligoendopeptidase F [bacterium]
MKKFFYNSFKEIILGLSILSVFSAQMNLFAQESSAELIKRENIDPKYTWNLDDIFKSPGDWEADYKFIDENSPKYKEFEGKLGGSAQTLLQLFKFDEEISIKIDRLFLYASLSKDLDLANSENSSRYDRITSLASKVSAISAFVKPEILSIPEDILWKYVDSENGLKIYKHKLDDLLRTKAHTLSKDQEELMALASPVTQVAYNTFGMFKNAEMEFPKIKDEQGNDMVLSDGRYYAALYSNDRTFRKRAYKGYYEPYVKYKNTFLSLFTGNLKSIGFNAKARKYNTDRQAALDANNIPESVYDNLVNTVNQNVSPLHRWAALKKKILGVTELHPYDSYVTLFPGVKKEFTYDQSVEILLKALAPLGEDYLKSLKLAFENRWIDVFETKGKRSGAYSSGVSYGVHPYVLLNWNNQLNDLFTFVHEMGHNMHSFYTEKNQPYVYANYSIFVAEVASTMNEALLLDYLINNAETKEEKLALIEQNLNNITTTFYRQTAFAYFEQIVHSMSENDETMTPEILCDIFGEIYKNHWGPDMNIDTEETSTWARIPHFYYNFYVYQYATSFAGSQALAAKVKTEGQPAIDQYLNFLKAGSTKYPIEVLKDAGVDMNSPEPILAVVKKMNELLDKMEAILAE